MKIGRVTVGAAATLAALAFGQARASDPPGASPEDPVEQAKPAESPDAQQRGSAPQGATSAIADQGTGSGGGEAVQERDRRERRERAEREGVSYPLPDQDPELKRLLSE
ncbi:hypothetical protein [Anaeromyxobacter diazotrophicus]|uniref:Uncharacterized protein n=1 Tax=Anaeromyxobacter diazotrophicus TaxID=2590199 RepID=A0A7I9VM99_9BACT|nr:hypothetical protein [Anaeromyxobacter diazotrophicus]GEJ57533.1 hypothetical protein AMYX_22740 [Anaeromyxobacter diazotrophicus]